MPERFGVPHEYANDPVQLWPPRRREPATCQECGRPTAGPIESCYRRCYACCKRLAFQDQEPQHEKEQVMSRKFGSAESRYLAKVDLEASDGSFKEPVLAIDTVTEEEVGEEKDRKYILFFRGSQGPIAKGLALNKTNETMLIDLYGEPNGDTPEAIAAHFKGKTVQLYFDPTVMYAGRRVGGLRLRGIEPPPAEEPPPPGDDTIPF